MMAWWVTGCLALSLAAVIAVVLLILRGAISAVKGKSF